MQTQITNDQRLNPNGKPERFLRLPQVRVLVPYSRSTIYQLIAKGKFPKAISLGARAVAWRESDIENWIAERIAASEQVGRG